MVVNEDTHGILTALGFIDNGSCCCDRAWLGKATENGEVNRGNVNQSGKRPAAAGLFFAFGEGSRDCIALRIRGLGGDEHVRKPKKLLTIPSMVSIVLRIQ